MKAKNIGLLATLAMVVTVGGVYATWNYATTSPTSKEVSDISVGITAATGREKGVLSAVKGDDFSLTVENDGSYNTALYFDTAHDVTDNNAYIKVGFAPDADYEGTSISLKAVLTFADNDWNGNDIFDETAASTKVEFDISWTGTPSGTYYADVDCKDLFVLVSNSLKTSADHASYTAALGTLGAKIVVSEDI